MQHARVPDAAVDCLLDFVDVDGDGTVDYKELSRVLECEDICAMELPDPTQRGRNIVEEEKFYGSLTGVEGGAGELPPIPQQQPSHVEPPVPAEPAGASIRRTTSWSRNPTPPRERASRSNFDEGLDDGEGASARAKPQRAKKSLAPNLSRGLNCCLGRSGARGRRA